MRGGAETRVPSRSRPIVYQRGAPVGVHRQAAK